MNTGTKLTPKMIQDLSTGYSLGKTTTQLAQEYGISKATVCRGLRKSGIEPERNDNLFTNKTYSEEETSNIIEDFTSGMSIKDLKSKYKVSYPALVCILEEAGVYTQKKLTLIKDPVQTSQLITVGNGTKRILTADEQIELCDKFQDGPLTRQELALEYKIHPDTVNAILRRNNVSIKKYVPEEIVDSFSDDFENNIYNVFDISKIYQIEPALVRYWLTKRGLLDSLNIEAETAQTRDSITRADVKKLASEHSLDAMKAIISIIENPVINPRTTLAAAQALIEIAHGKSREEPEESNKVPESNTDKIMRLIDKKKVFNK